MRAAFATVACTIVACTILALASDARAQDTLGCPRALRAWAAACAAGDDPIQVVECPAGHAIFAVGPGRLRVDVSRRPEHAFVATGELGASPIGELPDWGAVPEADRAAFDGLVRCMRERPDALVDALAAAPDARESEHHADRRAVDRPTPWRIVLAALLALAVIIPRRSRALAVDAIALSVLGAATLFARRALAGEAYFHQNGQGPFWIAHALGEPSNYGPGYAQVFHWIASRAADPDGAVFFSQGVLCALVPPAAFAIALGAGAPRVIAWSAALAVALSPIEARLAGSESYFATCGALLALAAAVLATCVRRDASTRAKVIASCAAGLFIAEAALVHPVSWLAAALAPIVVVVGDGAVGERARLAAIATGSIAAVVLVAAGPSLLRVLTGPLGAQWLGPAQEGHERAVPREVVVACVIAVAALVVAARSARLRRAGVAIGSLSVVVIVGWIGNLLGAAPAFVHQAYHWLYLAPGLAAVAALARELKASADRSANPRHGPLAIWLAASSIGGVAMAWHIATFSFATELPTDAREAALVREWRAELPEGAVVGHLERAGNQIVGLPLYDRRSVRFFADRSPADLTALGTSPFLYRSGLCTTVRGRDFCESIDAQYVLEPIRTAVLPAVPSMEGLDYDRSEVEVGLYRVRGRRSPSITDDGSSSRREGR